jgi:hypothetical protein
MSDTKFTPGPWAWSEDKWNGGWSGLYAEDGAPVVVPQCRNDGDDGAAWFATVDDAGEEGLTDTDRALIAAAPDLYDAANEALAVIERIKPAENGVGTIVRLKKAIAKAGGETS